jgi:sugar lactone lactonase YvrE
MAYNYNKGTQVVGDIVGADDSNRDTKIDFADNQINLQTAGSTVIAVKSSTVEITGSLVITEASTTRNNLGLGDIVTQNSSSVTIAGGTINNTTIGATSQNSGKFTTLSASSNLNVAGNTVLDGALFFYGNGIFGDDSSDNITVNARITGSLFAINGGAINNTTIGNITPSTANFTQLTGSNVLVGSTSTSNITLGGILYSNKTGSATAQATNPIGLFFKSDGTIAYVADITTNKVFQYTLSTAWDVSTMSYASKTASVATEESALQDIFIHPDGTYLYAIGTTGDDVNQYTLSTPWDISTATFFGSSSANGSEATPTGLFFKPDGTSVFIVGSTTDTVRQHVLGTAWDVRTMSVSALNSYSVSAQEGSPSGVSFSSDGKKMFLVGGTVGVRTVYEYLLPTAWNLSSISKVVPHDLSSTALLSNSVITCLFLKEDGTSFYVINNIGDTVIQYQTITSSFQVYDAPIQLVEGMTAFGAVAAPSISTTTLKASAATFNTISNTSTITSVGTISGSSTLLVGGAITGSNALLSGALTIRQQDSSNGFGVRFFQTGSTTNHWDIYINANNDLRFLYNDNLSFGGFLDDAANVAAIDFTGQHRNIVDVTEQNSLQDKIGMIVVSAGSYINSDMTQKPSINESLPTIKLSSQRNEKSVWGVVSNLEDPNDLSRQYRIGIFVSVLPKQANDDNRVVVNSIGEGAIWVCNANGNLQNGDYITTCEVPGLGMKQDSEFLANYTVAKITQDCDFDLNNSNYDCVEFVHNGTTYRKAFVGCTYHCG